MAENPTNPPAPVANIGTTSLQDYVSKFDFPRRFNTEIMSLNADLAARKKAKRSAARRLRNGAAGSLNGKSKKVNGTSSTATNGTLPNPTTASPSISIHANGQDMFNVFSTTTNPNADTSQTVQKHGDGDEGEGEDDISGSGPTGSDEDESSDEVDDEEDEDYKAYPRAGNGPRRTKDPAVQPRSKRRKIMIDSPLRAEEVQIPKALWPKMGAKFGDFPSFTRPFPWKESGTPELPDLLLEFVANKNDPKRGYYRQEEVFLVPCDICRRREEPCCYRKGLRKCTRCAAAKNPCKRDGQSSMKGINNVSARRDKANNKPDPGPIDPMEYLRRHAAEGESITTGNVPSTRTEKKECASERDSSPLSFPPTPPDIEHAELTPEPLSKNSSSSHGPPLSLTPTSISTNMSYRDKRPSVNVNCSLPTSQATTSYGTRKKRKSTFALKNEHVNTSLSPAFKMSPSESSNLGQATAPSTTDSENARDSASPPSSIPIPKSEPQTASATIGRKSSRYKAGESHTVSAPGPSKSTEAGMKRKLSEQTRSSKPGPSKLARTDDTDNKPILTDSGSNTLDTCRRSFFAGREVDLLGDVSSTSARMIYDGLGAASEWSMPLRLAVIRLLESEFHLALFKNLMERSKLKKEIRGQFELMLKILRVTAFESGVLVRRLAQHEDVWPFPSLAPPPSDAAVPSPEFDEYKRLMFRDKAVPILGDISSISQQGIYEGQGGEEGPSEWSETLRLVAISLIDLEWHRLSLEASMREVKKREIRGQIELLQKDNDHSLEECRVLLRRLAEHEDVWPIQLS